MTEEEAVKSALANCGRSGCQLKWSGAISCTKLWRSTVAAAERSIAGRIDGDLERPARLFNLYRQYLTSRGQPIDSGTFDV